MPYHRPRKYFNQCRYNWLISHATGACEWCWISQWRDILMSVVPSQNTATRSFFRALTKHITTHHYWSFVKGIHRGPVDSLHKGLVMQKEFPTITKRDNLHIPKAAKHFTAAMSLVQCWKKGSRIYVAKAKMMIATMAGRSSTMLTQAKRKAGIWPMLPGDFNLPKLSRRYGYSAPDLGISVPSSA